MLDKISYKDMSMTFGGSMNSYIDSLTQLNMLCSTLLSVLHLLHGTSKLLFASKDIQVYMYLLEEILKSSRKFGQ